MKLTWKGKYKSVEQLSYGNLPADAVKFKEPNSPLMVNLVSSLFVIPVFILIGVTIYVKGLFAGVTDYDFFNTWGILLALLMIIPHELLHAIMFPKDAEVEIWFSLKNMMAFVFSTYPVTKKRFILLSLLPNIVFGVIPLFIWLLIPKGFTSISNMIFSFAFFSLLFGIGDYMNVFNAAIQMPAKSITQLSGFHSYWYLPEEQKN